MAEKMEYSRDKIVSAFKDNYDKSENTADRYAREIPQWFDYLEEPGSLEFDKNQYDRPSRPFWEATTGNLKRYLKGLLNNGYAPGTVEIRLASISSFYQVMSEVNQDPDVPVSLPVDDSLENPADDVGDISEWGEYRDRKIEKEENSPTSEDEFYYLTPNQVKKLVNNVPSPKPRNELIIKLLFHTGARRKELAKTKLEDFDHEKHTVDMMDTKNNQKIERPYPARLQTEIDRWRNVHRKALATANSNYMFPTTHSEHIHPHYINEIVKKAAENAGIQATSSRKVDGKEDSKVTAHALRHGFAMDRLENGLDIVTIKELMGHSKLETTKIYLDMDGDTAIDRYRETGASKLTD